MLIIIRYELDLLYNRKPHYGILCVRVNNVLYKKCFKFKRTYSKYYFLDYLD